MDINYQTMHGMDNTIIVDSLFGSGTSFDTVPRPNAEFDWVRYLQTHSITHSGTQEQRDRIRHIRLSIAEIQEGQERPQLSEPLSGNSVSSSTDGTSLVSVTLDKGWGPVQYMNGSGGSGSPDVMSDHSPYGFAVDLNYIVLQVFTRLLCINPRN